MLKVITAGLMPRLKSESTPSGRSRYCALAGVRIILSNQDFRDLLAEFNAREVDFLIVGAHALAAHGHVRATNDINIWIRPDLKNARRVIAALQEFGAPLQDLSENDLTAPDVIFQIGVAPIRVDVMTSIDGVEFEEAWLERLESRFADQSVSVISKEHLIQNKKASGRKQDLADIEWLEKH